MIVLFISSFHLECCTVIALPARAFEISEEGEEDTSRDQTMSVTHWRIQDQDLERQLEEQLICKLEEFDEFDEFELAQKPIGYR